MFDFVSFIPRAIVQGIPLLFGSTGETLTEKSGNLNLGVPGIMYLGGIAGLAASFFYELDNPDPNPVVCLLLSFACAATWGRRYTAVSLPLASLYAITDEVHQRFVPGRSCQATDWAIDTAGAALGLLCAGVLLWLWLRYRTKKARQELTLPPNRI